MQDSELILRLCNKQINVEHKPYQVQKMKYIYRYKYLLVVALLGLNISCKHLDTSPDAAHDIEINSEDKIAELLTAAYPDASYFSFLEARTDNVGERPHGTHYRLDEAMYYWEDYDQEDLDTPLSYWRACYKGIAQANKALELLKAYPKTDRVRALYGEAFMLRAYLHFMLVTIWCEPYRGEQTTAPGIPYLRQPEKHALVDYDRGTVAEVYRQIEEDLRLGISLVDDRYYRVPRFHFTKRAAYAFASRFYLHKGDWQAVVDYSDYVLGYNPATSLRSWQRDVLGATVSKASLHQYYLGPESRSNLLLTTTESRIARDLPTKRFAPTLATIKEVFSSHGIEGYEAYKTINLLSNYYFLSSPDPVKNGYYIAKFDERAMLVDNSSLRPRDLYVTNVLLSSDEVMLNRMEALAMLGDYDRSIEDLIVYLKAKFGVDLPNDKEQILSTSGADYTRYTPYYGLTMRQLAMVKIVLGLRRMEFYEEGLRWLDIKRFYLPVQRDSKSSLYLPLDKEDPRKLLQIPTEAIKRGLVPNPR